MRKPDDVFSGYDSPGAVTFAATATTIPMTDEHVQSSNTYELVGGIVTIKEKDRYEVNFGAGSMVTTNARTQAQAYLAHNGVEVPGTRVALYCRQANHGATGSAQLYLDLDVDDTISIEGIRTSGSGTCTSLPNGSRITIRRVGNRGA